MGENEDGGEADPITELLTAYNELNGSAVDELDDEPSPLEFMRYVARNTPFVVRRYASGWTACTTWNVKSLQHVLGRATVNVAVTPKGNADSPTCFDDTGGLVFAKPWEEDQPFADFLQHLIRQETDRSFSGSEVRYAQTQNDNLRDEYLSLYGHVEKDIPFARIALQKDPDAINLWIGNSRSVTALHKDNYENIYVQVLGRKHFVLLPPVCHACVNEETLAPATYCRSAEDGSLSLQLDPNAAEGRVPFATWDPDRPDERATAYSHLAAPVRVTLDPGDMLYLPAMWYHKVSQSASPEGICVAVNYWYDMDFSGPLYPFGAFVRSVYLDRQRTDQMKQGKQTSN